MVADDYSGKIFLKLDHLISREERARFLRDFLNEWNLKTMEEFYGPNFVSSWQEEVKGKNTRQANQLKIPCRRAGDNSPGKFIQPKK